MSNADTNSQTPMQKISYLAICSLALSICAAICAFAPFIMDWVVMRDLDGYVLGLEAVCGWFSFILGFFALIQKSVNYRRLWWLALVGIGILVVLVILNVIGIIFVLVFMDF